MPNSSTKTLEVSEVVELLFTYIKSLGKKVPDKWDPSMNPFKGLRPKEQRWGELAEEFGKLIGHDLPDDCTPLVARDTEGKKRARTLSEITEFLNTQIT